MASAVFGSIQTKNDGSLFPSAAGKYEAGGVIGDDSDESQPTTPTPLAKTAQALHTVQDHTIPHEADRHWTAFESNEALRKIVSRIRDAEGNIEVDLIRSLKYHGWTKAGVAAEVTKSLSPILKNVEDKVMDKMGKARNAFVAEVAPLKGVKEEVVKTSQATFSLTKAVESNASQLEALSRIVEQLSGQLINEVKCNRQQQESES